MIGASSASCVARAGAIAIAVVAAFACSSGSGGGGGFPYHGPSCASDNPSDACWSCVQSNCGSLASCVTGAGSDYVKCRCACAQFDSSCWESCASQNASAYQSYMGCPFSCDACSSQCSCAGVAGNCLL